MDITLKLPFVGDYPITFAFGATSDDEEIKKKFSEWGIVGHNGIDYGLPEGTEVVAAADGKVVQAGENEDFGISITVEHPWGQSLYAHLKEIKVTQDQEVKAGGIIGLSGKTGAAFGEHLHFGIKPTISDANNGYLGFIDPSPYFAKLEEKPPATKIQPQEQPKAEEQKPVEQPQSPQTPQPEIKEVIKEVLVASEQEVQRQVEEKLKEKLLENKKQADEKRAQNRKDNLSRILELVQTKKEINNQDVRDLLQVSQSTATNYLAKLVSHGSLKVDKKARATIYSG